MVFSSKVSLAVLMAVAVLLNLMIASLAGVFIPAVTLKPLIARFFLRKIV